MHVFLLEIRIQWNETAFTVSDETVLKNEAMFLRKEYVPGYVYFLFN